MRFCLKSALAVCLPLALAACRAEPAAEAAVCHIVLEESAAFTADALTAEVSPGQSAAFVLKEADGYTLTGADYPGAVLRRSQDGCLLTLPEVLYSTAVAVTSEKSDTVFYYHANGGVRLDGGDAAQWVACAVTDSHLRLNTSQGTALFTRAGCTLTGWNTAADGSGTAVGLGSRTVPGARLYAQWAAWNSADEFTWTENNGGAIVTDWTGTSQTLVVPAVLGGLPVTELAGGAFAGADITAAVLPEGLRVIQPDAFADCAALQTVTLFDSLTSVTDYAFSGCGALQTLHVNAAVAPVYSTGYYAAFADKYDRLLALAETPKLVLFSGSSARFGYDSAALDDALPHYGVVNMGVFAYTNALPQLELIAGLMQPGDILLLSPEFDAAKRQFCTTNAMDEDFFCMMEANYDALAALDLRGFSGTFSAFGSYLKIRSGMTARSYALSPSDYDEDGNPTDTPSYNDYGDYILYRPNAADDTPIYGLAVEYTVAAFPKALYLDAANAAWQPLLDAGLHVYLTYSPRNSRAVSADSTPQAVAALDAYLRENLCVPILTALSDSLMPGRYFSGTDNHLSTEGVALRTAQVIDALTAQMQKEGLTP